MGGKLDSGGEGPTHQVQAMSSLASKTRARLTFLLTLERTFCVKQLWLVLCRNVLDHHLRVSEFFDKAGFALHVCPRNRCQLVALRKWGRGDIILSYSCFRAQRLTYLVKGPFLAYNAVCKRDDGSRVREIHEGVTSIAFVDLQQKH